MADTKPTGTSDPPCGRIDIHSHMLPGIDDGCENMDQVLESIKQLKAAGYVGSICTPHVYPEAYPLNTAPCIETLTAQLNAKLGSAGVAYRLWPGGEVRLFDGVIDWLKVHGVPTLAGSRCVLTDFWPDKWPRWIDTAYDWFIGNGFQPILAHPERIPASKELDAGVTRLIEKGVWLQGNFRSFTGAEGYATNRLVRQWLTNERYQFLALDMHRPESLDSRLDGVQLLVEEFGGEIFDEMTITVPRRLIFGVSDTARAVC